MSENLRSLADEIGSVTGEKSGELKCFHCGDKCDDDSIAIGDKIFCCNGCKSVYLLLSENEMCNYYSYNEQAGIRPENVEVPERFAYLDDEEVKQKLIEFSDGETSTVTFHIPQMHCSSCIYLLEQLYKITPGIMSSRVNFLRKEATIRFSEEKITLRQVVEVLSKIGYEPKISLANLEEKSQYKNRKQLYLKIGLAGFAFGNVMLLSFPEYLSRINAVPVEFARFFGLLSLALSVPALFYSARDYFISAWTGLKQKNVNIDVPISLGMTVLFVRSAWEILTQTGAGYLDSLTGLIFFLLIGKLFQQKTYDSLSFERDFKSYFPIAITRVKNKIEEVVPLSKLKVGDRLAIHNNEIIPADSILLNGEASIDYSFVTGESEPVQKKSGDMLYAGGRQLGPRIEVEVIKEVSQSYLTRLWNDDDHGKKAQNTITKRVDTVSKYFTFIILTIAFSAAGYWLGISHQIAINVFTAVLIVACPCALALSYPFTMGNAMRIMGRKDLFLKDVDVVERMAVVDSIVFDKTGTLTHSRRSEISFEGTLDKESAQYIYTATSNSVHPLSKEISEFLLSRFSDLQALHPLKFEEIPGKGIKVSFSSGYIYVGNRSWVKQFTDEELPEIKGTVVYCIIKGKYPGHFKIKHAYREGIKNAVTALKEKYQLSVISGDNDQEREDLAKIFGEETPVYFRQGPPDKVKYIRKLREKGAKTLMIGDGLNDGAALKVSNVGFSVAEDNSQFTPASDGILAGDSFTLLPKFLDFSRSSVNIVKASFVLSFVYNIVGLSFAVDGLLTPIVAAILMPLSSISVIAFSTLSTYLIGRKKGIV